MKRPLCELCFEPLVGDDVVTCTPCSEQRLYYNSLSDAELRTEQAKVERYVEESGP